MNRILSPRRCLSLLALAVLLTAGSGVGIAQGDAYARGVAAFRAREYRRSADLFAQAEVESPGATDALLYKGKSLANLGDLGASEEVLRSYLERHPNSADGLAFLGFVLHRENKPKESLELYTSAAKIETPHGDDLKIVALDYVLLNDMLDATRWLEKCTEMEPSNHECWYYLGRAYFTDGRFREAKPAFERVLTLRAHDAKAEDYLGLILDSENRKEEAIHAYRNAIAWQKESGHESELPYLDLAMLYDRQGSSEQATEPLLEGIKINPQSALLYERLGQVYMHLGRYKSAKEQLENALTLDPRSASAHFQLGRACRQLGLSGEAQAEFAKAQELFGAGPGPPN